MMKLIIVEDENIVRLGLSTILPWSDYHFELCGLFKNGQEALQYLLKHPVDIVLTDIKMPVMGGDQLVQKIREHQLSPYIVILSNYDDYELVRRCFQYGATDYLLKQDLEKETLLELLQKISDQIGQTEEEPEEPAVSTYEFFSALVKTDFQEDIAQMDEKYQKIWEHLQDRSVCICVADLIYSETKKRYTGVNPVYSVLEKLLKETLNKYCKNYIFLYTDKSLLMVLCPETEHTADFYSVFSDAVNEINTRMMTFFNISLRAGISDLFPHTTNLKMAFEQALLCHTALFYTKQTILAYGLDRPARKKHTAPSVNYLSVRDAVKIGNLSLLRQLCEKQFQDLEKTQMLLPQEVSDYIRFILITLDQFLNETLHMSLSQFEENWDTFHTWYHFTLQEMKEYLFDILDQVSEAMQSREASNEIVLLAKQYINDHYQENITLSSVANYLHMNASYVSSLFKLKTDVSFTQYLTEIRIQNALLLVTTTQKSAAEIGELVGYSNPNYFIKVFKKVTGYTISEYRNRRSY